MLRAERCAAYFMAFSFLVSPQPSQRKVQHRRSSHNLVSHATVSSRADVLFGVKVIWESGIDLARLVECLYLFRRERQVEARKIILQLRQLAVPRMIGMTGTGR